MRNLFLLIWKYQFLILFLFFETAAGYLIVKNNGFQNAVVVNSSNAVAGSVMSLVKGVTEYLSLGSVNEQLVSENARLRTFLAESYHRSVSMPAYAPDTSRTRQYFFISAKVINNSTGRRNNYMTLNRGSADGISPEMGVISSRGIVGIVKNVSPHFSAVISLLHKDFHTSARLSGSNYFGNLEWPGGDPSRALVVEMPKHVSLHRGDTLLTSPYSTIFPEGIPVASIEDFTVKAGDNFYTITVKLLNDFSNQDYVYVCGNRLKEEQEKLEASPGND